VEVLPAERGCPLCARCAYQDALSLALWQETKPIDEFGYEEHVDGTDHSSTVDECRLFAGTRMTIRSLSTVCASPCGESRVGLVEGLPTHNFYTDEGDLALKVSDRSSITPTGARRTGRSGFVPLVPLQRHGLCRFFSVQTLSKPKLSRHRFANAMPALGAVTVTSWRFRFPTTQGNDRDKIGSSCLVTKLRSS